MRQKIQHIVTLLLLLPLFFACQEELPFAPATDGSYLSLSLATQAITRATENGEDAFNENKIERADVYFFPATAETDGNQTCIYAQLGLRPSPNGGDNTLYTLQVPLNKTVISDGTSYYVYVVANHDFVYTVETEKDVTLDDIKERTITTAWKSGYTSAGTGETDVEKVKESSLVMDGGEQITIQDNLETPETIDMTRAMAKVTLSASTEETIESNGLTYTPIPRGMFATLVYGVQSTNLAVDYALNAENDYVIRMRRNYNPQPTDVTVDGETRHRYSQVAPFYSYPNPVHTTDRKDTYLILCVPWMVKEEGDVSYQSMNYYYRVPITGTGAPAELERNHYYKINVHIGVLGSLNPYEAVELKADFEIIDWFEVGIDADIQQYQYLVLDEYSSVLNNVAEIEMPYISSSPLKMAGDGYWDTSYTRITKVTYPNYKAETQDASYTSTVTLEGDEIVNAGFSIDESNGQLIFNHPISSQDYVPYTITVEVWNTQGKHVTWEITQYPAIYIVGDYNPNGRYNRFIYGKGGSEADVYDDYTNLWGNHTNSLGGVNNPNSGATNNNQNQYTIYITSFDIEGSDYAIGDPRSSTVNNLLYLSKTSGWNASTGQSGKYLTHYYPTRKNDVERVIAPAFKIASSWGVVDSGSLTYETAQRRCASYQENGYPAGRWRIPTEAEIEYIVSLSDREVIPTLFGGDYYASSGRYYNNEIDWNHSYVGFYPESDGHSVRCVYDVWYWGNDKLENPNRFTWGDEPMR